MRKLLSILTIAIMVVFSSCELNEVPLFDDSDAFVAFDRASLSIAENGGTLNIPVTVASVKGATAMVSYTIIDGTAKQGVNFTLVDGSGTLSFDANNRTQNIQINIIDNPGVFTGDLKFQVKLSDEGTIKPNAESVCTVTIQDLDHPLSKFFGEWTAKANSYSFGDGKEWTVIIDKDPTDVTVLWIQNIVFGFVNYGFTYPTYDTRYYGVVDNDKDKITFPLGQKCAYKYSGIHDIFLYGVTAAGTVSTTGVNVASLSADDTVLTFELGFQAYDATGSWDALKPGMTWTKK